MTQNDTLNILPFYTDLQQQNHRKDFADMHIYPLIALNSTPPPFQLNVSDELVIERFSAELIDMQDNVTNIDAWISNLRLVTLPNYGLLINDANTQVVSSLLEGQYYIKITIDPDDGDPYFLYSEVFTFVTSVADCLKLEYYDNQNFVYDYGEIAYDGIFKNFVYLQTQLGKPDYPFEEEVTQRDGYRFTEKQISEKQYKFDFLAPEFLCDALRLVRMHDNINITNVDGKTYSADSFLMTVKWQQSGYIASVEAEFECNTVIKKIAKSYAQPPVINGDFNNDFNIDFNT